MSSVDTGLDDIGVAELDVFCVLMSRPILVDALLKGGFVEVVGDQVDPTEAEESASAHGEARLANAVSDVSEAMDIHE